MTFFAVCFVNGPISVEIDAESVVEAVEIFESGNHQAWIDDASTDAEDDLDFCGKNMSESEFAEALESFGCEQVCDLALSYSHPSSPMQSSYHIAGGWVLWQEK
jgi:hypothetical protein